MPVGYPDFNKETQTLGYKCEMCQGIAENILNCQNKRTDESVNGDKTWMYNFEP